MFQIVRGTLLKLLLLYNALNTLAFYLWKEMIKSFYKKDLRDFPGSPAVKTASSAGGMRLIHGWGTTVPNAT